MGAPTLKAPRLRVIREGQEDLELQTANPDFLAWDMTRPRHKWPILQEAPFLWLTFMAWSAARRTGAIAQDHTWERWRDEVLDVQVVKGDPEGPDASVVDPFLAAPGDG